MKTAKKLALLAMVAIAGYASYSFSITPKERDTFKDNADKLLAMGTKISDSQMKELENTLSKLETTEKYGKFARENKVKMIQLQGQIAVDLITKYAEEVKGKLTGPQKEKMDFLVYEVDNLKRVIAQCESHLTRQYHEREGYTIEKGAEIRSLEDQRASLEEMLTQQHSNIAATLGMRSNDITIVNAIQKLGGYVQAFHALVQGDKEKYDVFGPAIGAPAWDAVARLICEPAGLAEPDPYGDL